MKYLPQDQIISVIRRFWEYAIVKGHNECWEWVGPLGKDNRGVLSIGDTGHRITASRLSLLMNGADLPDEKLACHKCGNANCVNPNHLYSGTNITNGADASAMKRLNGQNKTHCKHGHELTADNVRIRSNGTRNCKACQRIVDHNRTKAALAAYDATKGTK